jgi:hypothetical protein
MVSGEARLIRNEISPLVSTRQSPLAARLDTSIILARSIQSERQLKASASKLLLQALAVVLKDLIISQLTELYEFGHI